MSYRSSQSGYLLVLVLVFGSIFMVIASSFVSWVISQNNVVNFRHEQQRATEIAEAGLNHYRWYLAHFPDDLTTSTTTVFSDPETGPIGEYTLNISRNSFCGSTASIEVESTAFTYVNPSAVSTVRARYSRPTVAEFSFITNGGVWYGADRVITGPVHSNQGIRMDGAHNSFVGSGQTDWTCTGTFGCSPDQVVDGVFTTTVNATPGLFAYPVSPVDFAGITLDLSDMKDRAENDGGIYYGPSSGWGYHVVFNGDGTITIREVTSTQDYWAYSSYEGWHTGERNVITNSIFVANEAIDPDCPVLYFEDKVWLEGQVSDKVTIAAADLSSGAQTNLVIEDSITYSSPNSGLLAIAEDDIDVGLEVPDDMTANGIFIAQNGRFGRNNYCESCGEWIWVGFWTFRNYGLPWWLDPYVCQDRLTRFGSVVSNGRVGTKWTSGTPALNICGSGTPFMSGFEDRVTSFDAAQVDNPPPLTPETSDVYIFDNWRQDG
jgi:hypothetical protein